MKHKPTITVFVKCKSFLPDTATIPCNSNILFKNEDNCVYNIQCKGSSKIPEVKLRKSGSAKIHFPLPGRYELTCLNDSSIKVSFVSFYDFE
jgi:plastocyanin